MMYFLLTMDGMNEAHYGHADKGAGDDYCYND